MLWIVREGFGSLGVGRGLRREMRVWMLWWRRVVVRDKREV